MALDANAVGLLEAMIGAMAVVWAISVAIYVFTYEYFDRRYGDCVRHMAYDPGELKLDRNVGEMLARLCRNECVYRGYRIAGVGAVLSIFVSLFILLSGVEPASLPLALFAALVFSFVVLGFLALFTHEIGTSIDQMRCLRGTIIQKLPPSPPSGPPH